MEIVNIILPVALTVLGNYFFYIRIKNSVDKTLEDYKISYAGVFKERIDIYKAVLKYIIDIDGKIYTYHISGNEAASLEIMNLINEFINFTSINRPFLSTTLIEKLTEVRIAHQETFDKIFMSNNLRGLVPPDRYQPYFIEAMKALNTLKGKDFKNLQELIVKEMRADMKVL